jgi:ribonuclease HII
MNKILPNLNIENSYKNIISGYICGIDEVGRGCLAGPVVAAAIILDFKIIPKDINDSKKLSKIKRENLSEILKDTAIDFAIGEASNKEIDNLNILKASLLAMKRAYEKLKVPSELALIDGPYSPNISCKTDNIIQGDTKSVSIAAASIIAKQSRDKIMEEIGLIYPKYNFKNNAGYGTKEHYKIIESNGITSYHRKSFRLFK